MSPEDQKSALKLSLEMLHEQYLITEDMEKALKIIISIANDVLTSNAELRGSGHPLPAPPDIITQKGEILVTERGNKEISI
jgi:hypothetical protein